jgi:hypothetical protein
MTDRFDPHDLAPGDVLLYRGASDLSAAIRFFDGSEVSHASVHLGRGLIAEALGTGLVRRSLAASLADADWTLVLRLKDPPTEMTPVRKRALRFVAQGHRYAYEQIGYLLVPDVAAGGAQLRRSCGCDAAALAAGRRWQRTDDRSVFTAVRRGRDRADDAYSIVIERGARPGAKRSKHRSERPRVHPQSRWEHCGEPPVARANRAP